MFSRVRTPALAALLIVVLGLALAACGAEEVQGECLSPEDGVMVPSSCDLPPGSTAEPTPTFTPTMPPNGGGNSGMMAFQNLGCGSCHAIDGTDFSGQTGPNLTNIQSMGEDYVRESIVDPNAVIAEECPGGPCQSGVMPTTFGDQVPEQTIDDLVDYLMGL